MAKVPPYKLICKYVENVNIILEYRGASGPQEKKKKKNHDQWKTLTEIVKANWDNNIT